MSNYRIARLQHDKRRKLYLRPLKTQFSEIKWSLVLSFLLVAAGWSLAKPTWAGPLDFGGLIGPVTPCPSPITPGLMFHIVPSPFTPPSSIGFYFWPITSIRHKWYLPPIPSHCALGKAIFGGACVIPVPFGPPIVIPTQKTVISMGISGTSCWLSKLRNLSF